MERAPVIVHIVVPWLILLTLGAVMVASAAVALDGAYLTKHLIYLGLALLLFSIAFAVPTMWWHKLYLVGWIGAVAICVLVLLPGIGHTVNGASRWVNLGSFTVQAAEVAKFGICIYLAGYLARHAERLRGDEGLSALLVPLAMVGAIAALLVLEPDLGSAVVITVASVGVLFIAGAKLRYFLMLILFGAGLLALLIWIEPYRLERLIAFLDPWAVQFGSGYQLTQALIAFGRGEVWGLGLGEGVQKLFYLPEAHTDFIFAVIAEELGSVGAIGVALLMSWLVLKILLLARTNLLDRRSFAGFAAYFLGLVIGIQFLVNLGVNTGVLPTKGLTLPFVSYGGNSLMILCALLGVVLRATLEELHEQ